ncbi:hypothetical protein PV10_02108 [Exophiala mesophila]|uniref:Uncharacterized protein n=1 Tax=Exophiala mesophila TaxID=212818 RepID=A0A0D1ZK82_EXOME|nr:uncharacterized protein PV10_02108 [Exophiala mesophila]KIV94334.1 hypothetical protein PV10_02108 [Exophiala mesophila]
MGQDCEKPHSCSICLRKFTRKEHLNRHQSRHSFNQRVSCPVCGRSFTRQDSLGRHIANHAISESQSSLKAPRACDACYKSKIRCEGGVPCRRCCSSKHACVFTRLHGVQGGTVAATRCQLEDVEPVVPPTHVRWAPTNRLAPKQDPPKPDTQSQGFEPVHGQTSNKSGDLDEDHVLFSLMDVMETSNTLANHKGLTSENQLNFPASETRHPFWPQSQIISDLSGFDPPNLAGDDFDDQARKWLQEFCKTHTASKGQGTFRLGKPTSS